MPLQLESVCQCSRTLTTYQNELFLTGCRLPVHELPMLKKFVSDILRILYYIRTTE